MEDRDWSLWGDLATRYREPAPRKILALDGGGIRGLITLGVLARLEEELAAATGKGADFRLCDYFDLIGGTSTGAIIATGLARGMSVDEITSFYREFGKEAFSPRRLLERWKSRYDDKALKALLQDTFGADTTLHPGHLRCLLVVVTRNATTDSAWPISSNPFAKYNDPSLADCNLSIPLWQLVRASTAAPTYFPPEVVRWDKQGGKTFVFVDGGTTPYNNPAFLLFRMATVPAYRLEWPIGEEDMLVVSVGTGAGPALGPTEDDPESNWASTGLLTARSLMSQISIDQDINCRTIGRCTHGGQIDREVLDLLSAEDLEESPKRPAPGNTGKAFIYARYNPELTPAGLDAIGLGHLDAKAVSKLDAVGHVDDLAAIGRAVGEQVKLDHLRSFAP
jgi:predicted acylesterase/phospholipase RssA